MRALLRLCILVICGTPLLGQDDITISGRILDRSNEEGIAYATVVLKADTSAAILSGTISDESGRFVLQLRERGNFVVQCSYLGFTTLNTDVLIGQKNNIYDLGKLYLEPESEQLEEVTVTAQKAIINEGLSKKSFSMADQIAQSGGSVAEAMKALPGVTIDQDGNVLLRGSDKVAVLIDGRQSGMTGFGNQRGLNNIPAANIDRIEIINNPSAKYDAAGMAGIINIIYKKERQNGFNGSVGFTYGLGELTTRKASLPTQLGRYAVNPKYIPSISLNYRTPKVNTYLQAEVIRQKKLPNNEFTTRHYADGANTVSQVPENRTQTHYVLKGGIDYQLDDRNALRFSSIYDYENHVDTAQVPYINLNTGQRYRYWHWREAEVTGYLNFRLDYEHDFREPGHRLNLAAQYVRGWEDESYFLNDSSEIRQANDMTHIIATEHTTSFTGDYIKPLKWGRLEAGAKVQIRTIPVTYDILRGQQSIIYEGLGDWSDWGENIVAAYANYILEKRTFDIEGGLRAEQTNVFYDISPENTFYPENDAYDYFELYPNIRLTFKISEQNNLSLFYNRRVDRPGEPELRIFPKYDDPELLKVGNPYLRPQFTQTFEVAYKRIWNSGSVYLATYHRIIENPFTRVYSIDSSDPNYAIVNKIYQNVGSGTNTGIEVLLSQRIENFWKLSTGMNLYNNVVDAYRGTLLFPTERPFDIQKTSDQTWDLKINNQFDLGGHTQIQLTGIYMAPKNIPQGRQLARSSVDLGVQRNIWGKKGELTLAFSDIFNGFGIRQEINGIDFSALYENYFETQVVRLGLKYKW
ncbi:outer membrane beta-barrel protein [Flavilitoribacter nigricans]|uniref:TonB-dependent receptor n=1 Tax=Flavilitoribacter nigricans (strain ATCC 23147 / DSM 23189 / NBRC 102662 / NCIMB 1420 / SS-2) TaxID=1122177 RepID=A0A2D0N0V7_FLAN2|nr:outer membrane beta-barrel protein [Flavilitoribacter nigricans]PHN02144.1 TonB-dependent receptor [Flavilitoribacter nigricans DSM 23189 = NBRC 102662]